MSVDAKMPERIEVEGLISDRVKKSINFARGALLSTVAVAGFGSTTEHKATILAAPVILLTAVLERSRTNRLNDKDVDSYAFGKGFDRLMRTHLKIDEDNNLKIEKEFDYTASGLGVEKFTPILIQQLAGLSATMTTSGVLQSRIAESVDTKLALLFPISMGGMCLLGVGMDSSKLKIAHYFAQLDNIDGPQGIQVV